MKIEKFASLTKGSGTQHNAQIRGSRPGVFCKKGVLVSFAKFTGKHMFQSFFFNKVAGLVFLKFRKVHRKTPENTLFYGEYCKIFKNTFFEGHLGTAVFVIFIFAPKQINKNKQKTSRHTNFI